MGGGDAVSPACVAAVYMPGAMQKITLLRCAV